MTDTTVPDRAMSRRRLLGGAAAAGLGVLAAAATGKAAYADLISGGGRPMTLPPAFPSPYYRFVWVEGAFNTRDFGGYQVGEGQIATGMLWRSSSLDHVDAAGLAALSGLNLGIVADFRSQEELVDSLDVLPAGTTNLFVPVGDPETAPAGVRVAAAAPAAAAAAHARWARTDAPANVAPADAPPPGGLTAPDPATIAEFQSYITSAEAKHSFGRAINTLAMTHQPFMWHCNSGTYRTGWATALLLTTLGVAKSDVYDDFLLSNPALGATYAFAEYLDAAFDKANEVFGSLEGYLHFGLRVSPATVVRLRHRLIHY